MFFILWVSTLNYRTAEIWYLFYSAGGEAENILTALLIIDLISFGISFHSILKLHPVWYDDMRCLDHNSTDFPSYAHRDSKVWNITKTKGKLASAEWFWILWDFSKVARNISCGICSYISSSTFFLFHFLQSSKHEISSAHIFPSFLFLISY